MGSFLKFLASIRVDRRGVTALEYGLIAAAVVAVGLAGFSVIGDRLSAEYTNVSGTLPDSSN